MRIQTSSFGFTVLLGLLAALPSFGIDMVLPAVTATGAALGVPPAQASLTVSVFLVSLGTAPLIYGPLSDRYGRKPVVVFGCTLLVIASFGCALAQSLPALLAWRVVQGAGAASTTMTAIAIIRDLFEGHAARAKMSYVVIAINVVPMIAPTAGAALLAFGDWRLLYSALVAIGLVLLLTMLLGFNESARIDPNARLTPADVIGNYYRVLKHPVCLGYILVNAATTGVIFAYVAGSPLFFINLVGLRPDQYSVIFGASAGAVMGGAFLNSRLSVLGVSPRYPMMIGLVLLAVAATLLLAMTLADRMPLLLVISTMFVVTFSFGLVTPNAMNAAMQPLPQIAGSVSAAAGCVQMMVAAGSTALVAILFDGRSALSMAAVMALFSALAVASYLRVVRPAERVAFRPAG